jgi:hypothetical protein
MGVPTKALQNGFTKWFCIAKPKMQRSEVLGLKS